jgi:hypothetical protein
MTSCNSLFRISGKSVSDACSSFLQKVRDAVNMELISSGYLENMAWDPLAPYTSGVDVGGFGKVPRC